MLSPLANVILFGLLVSTILTLFVIPSLIAVVDDLKRSRKKATALGLGIRTNGKLQGVYGERVEV